MRKQSLKNKPSLKRYLAVGLIAVGSLMLAGCVTVPDSIRGTTETPQMNLQSVQNAPQIFVGQEARFGGTVVNMVNEKDRTRLEIATVPLDSGARPILGEPSQGRVIAFVNGFIDPIDYRGQLITVVGPITGSEPGKIGMTPYNFVVMQANSYKRWRITQQVVMPPGPPMGPWGWGGYGSGWGPGFGGGWGWYDRGPAQVQNVVTE
ncbi:Slp family lipoprotein [Edaphovirga cremea]|uniref:Slp family lipoprotein n=1 Tax=Edaphovirga cremea TaxID=2267246 RepID=UPI000DEF1CE7|nr:Slp family lipoprotein [Edaphovirga cremea]